ncbi:MAG: ABC transporter permease [gamma proteobacterium symbiont of Bathyaustriella thionipta]|nr:ABC transporter permease [gamma proteobacterium symbiont of Bathyaustriella thionipta]
MYRIALQMLMGDKSKYTGLLAGISFTAFLVTFALAFFAGFMTQGFALVSENPSVDIWVMDPAVNSTEMTINIPASALSRVRGVKGVANAVPLSLNDVLARFPNGRFQTFQMIGVDDISLSGAPALQADLLPTMLYKPESVIVDAGGTSDKLQTPVYTKDKWPLDGVHLDIPTRPLAFADELLINDKRVVVAGVSRTIPRFPPRPLLYTTFSNVKRILPAEKKLLTFVLVSAQKGVSLHELAHRIEQQTGLRARTSADFKEDTVRWFLINSEDVGDITAMLVLAMTVGFGVTGIMLYMFTYENLKQYAVLKAMGAANPLLLKMVFVQAGTTAFAGAGIGIGLCALVGPLVSSFDFPFRLLWFTPLVGILGVLLVSLTAAAISSRPVLKLEPGMVFSGR